MYFNNEIHHFLQSFIENAFLLLTTIVDLFRPLNRFIVSRLLKTCGVELNGQKPWDIKVINERFYALLLCKASTGFGESYLEGYIEIEDVEEYLFKSIDSPMTTLASYHPYSILKYLIHKYFDVLTEENSEKDLHAHYDDSSGLAKMTTDVTLQYSTMIITDERKIDLSNIDQLQQILNDGASEMSELIAKKLNLKPGMKVLDIGCGYGGLAKHLASKYNVSVTGVTASIEMANFAKEVCDRLDVTIIASDYRRVTGQFDRIVCIEMFEHVGDTHHKEFFTKVHQLLKSDGLFLLSCYTINHPYTSSYDPLFENVLQLYAYFPRAEQIFEKSKGLLVIQNLQNLGKEAGLTAKAVVRMTKLKKESLIAKFGAAAYKEYMLCESIFSGAGRTNRSQLMQLLFSKTDDWSFGHYGRRRNCR